MYNKEYVRINIILIKKATEANILYQLFFTTAHSWYYGHFLSISTCGVEGARVGIQVSVKELHTHIHLD